jgi:hypothetical protein
VTIAQALIRAAYQGGAVWLVGAVCAACAGRVRRVRGVRVCGAVQHAGKGDGVIGCAVVRCQGVDSVIGG